MYCDIQCDFMPFVWFYIVKVKNWLLLTDSSSDSEQPYYPVRQLETHRLYAKVKHLNANIINFYTYYN